MRIVSLVCAKIADSFILFVANALVCNFNDRRATCVVIRCRLNSEVEMVLRSALSVEFGAPCAAGTAASGAGGYHWNHMLLLLTLYVLDWTPLS